MERVRKKRSLNNFKIKLGLAFAAILLVPSVTIGVSAYITAKHEIENQIINTAQQNVQSINSVIDDTIGPKIHDVEFFALVVNNERYNEKDMATLSKDFNLYASLHPEAVSIFTGNQQGKFIQSPKKVIQAGYDPRKRDWYKLAMQNKGKTVVTEPYPSASTGQTVITVAKTAADGTGVIALNLDISRINKAVSKVKIGEKGYPFLLDGERKYIVHPKEKAGTKAKDSLFDKLYTKSSGSFEYTFNGDEKKMVFTTNKTTNWKIAGTMYSSEVNEAAQPIFYKTLFIIVACLIIGSLTILVVLQSIIKPLKQLKNQALSVSEGDLTTAITVNSKDEIGELGYAFSQMQNNLRTLIQNVEMSAEQVAASSEELTASSQQTSAATEQVSVAIQEVASSAEKQTAVIDQNAASLDEIVQGVSTIAQRTEIVSKLSNHTTSEAVEGGKAVRETVEQMESISQSVELSNTTIRTLFQRSKEVGTILEVISGIAAQTNLLALNAAIEAARAGEHGKGFSVVAAEVRKLAEQSQVSASQISELIQAIQQDTQESVHTMEQVTNKVEEGRTISQTAIQKFEQILSSMNETTPQVEEVAATAQQISAAVEEVARTAGEMAILAKGNAATSEEVAASTEEQLASMEEIAISAQSLSQMAEQLTALISKFNL